MNVSNWSKKAILFIVSIDNKSKLGICNSWDEQLEQFKKDYGNVPIQLLMKTDFDYYWQAELVEQVVKLKLKPIITSSLYEWFKYDVPLQHVIDCLNQVRSILEMQYDLHEHIHKKGNHRWAFYLRVYENIKSRLSC